jgi:hypothetical protein
VALGLKDVSRLAVDLPVALGRVRLVAVARFDFRGFSIGTDAGNIRAENAADLLG